MRLLVVSNRLPITIQQENEKYSFQQSVGGVATGIASYIGTQKSQNPNFEYVWVGWPGDLAIADNADFDAKLGKEYLAVRLSASDMQNFYDGFCNKTLWPLFHYFPSMTEFEDIYWRQYNEVNAAYCARIAEILKPDDTVFINDYHLLLLPRLLRKLYPTLKISFFLHIPFPDFEIFRLLPSKWRTEILYGIAGANLVGFHTHQYTEHFLRCMQRILGFEHTLGEIRVKNHLLKVDTFPMGIDFAAFSEFIDEKPITAAGPPYDLHRILSIDRLDYTKGIINRLKGYELFLTKYPEMKQRVQLHVVAVPSRVGVDRYQNLKKQLDELVGNINGTFSRGNWLPIFYQSTTLTQSEVCSLYRGSDIALITPLRDGMNLIAKEYLAARIDETGVLVISEMAGAARELTGAIHINPNSISEIADAIKQALDMPRAEQVRRNRPMRSYLQRQDIKNWMREIIDALYESESRSLSIEAKYLSVEKQRLVLKEFHRAKKRIFLLDYDGTLVNFAVNPADVTTDTELEQILSNLSLQPDTLVFIISGRDRNFLLNNISSTNIGLIAEHGNFMRIPGQEKWRVLGNDSTEWFEKILPIMKRYENRVYGSFIEKKESALVFHFRGAYGEKELVQERANELFDDLIHFTANIEVQALRGSKLIEVRNQGATKGLAGLTAIGLTDSDFILAIGDDVTDEDLFKSLPDSAHTIRVGYGNSAAKYYLDDVAHCRRFLESLAQI